jgi:hypothetical protein
VFGECHGAQCESEICECEQPITWMIAHIECMKMDGSLVADHTVDSEVCLTQQPITRMIVPSRGDQENPPCLDLFSSVCRTISDVK